MESAVHLWTGQKDGEAVQAIVRSLKVGYELRIEFSNTQMFGQILPTLEAAHEAAAKRRAELEARGWKVTDRHT